MSLRTSWATPSTATSLNNEFQEGKTKERRAPNPISQKFGGMMSSIQHALCSLEIDEFKGQLSHSLCRFEFWEPALGGKKIKKTQPLDPISQRYARVSSDRDDIIYISCPLLVGNRLSSRHALCCFKFQERVKKTEGRQGNQALDRTMESYILGRNNPTKHMILASQSLDSQVPSTVITDITEGAELTKNRSSDTSIIDPTNMTERNIDIPSTTILEPASSILRCRSKRLLQPPERYFPSLFFTDAGELTTNKEAIEAIDVINQ